MTHGTCTTLAPEAFFALEHKAFHSVVVPAFLNDLDQEVMLKPSEVLDMFAKANPAFPAGSFVLSCGNNRLTAIEACLARDGLTPIACQNVHEYHAQVIRIAPRNSNSVVTRPPSP